MSGLRPAVLASLVLLLGLTAAGARGGTIGGRVFTAQHPDSVAQGAAVTLFFRDDAGQMARDRIETDGQGHFHFTGLAQDTSIAYVLQIEHGGRSFLSASIRFEPGQDEVSYSVLLTEEAPEGADLPAGHPPLPGQGPPLGRPIRPNPIHTLLIVLWVTLVFGLLAIMARPRPSGEQGSQPPVAYRALVRDIASLDNRREDGVIGEEEYRKVRDGLVSRLRMLTRRSSG